MREKRQAANARGIAAEEEAARYLVSKGWEIVERRFKVKAGEVDIIARRGDLIAFVEVKARRLTVSALESVSARSRARIRSAGQEWLAAQEDGPMLSWRCDLIAIVPGEMPLHIEGAW